VVIQLRNTQPVSLVNAFERPVYAGATKGQAEAACERLVRQELALESSFGVAPIETYVICGDPSTIDALSQLADPTTLQKAVTHVENHVTDYLMGLGMVDEGQE
jgi:CRISPR system Cascade subunit CasC